MATSTVNPDGTLTVMLTTTEHRTLAGLTEGQFDGYMTLWLAERAPKVFMQRFEKLPDIEKEDVLTKILTAEEAEKIKEKL